MQLHGKSLTSKGNNTTKIKVYKRMLQKTRDITCGINFLINPCTENGNVKSKQKHISTPHKRICQIIVSVKEEYEDTFLDNYFTQ